MAKTRTRRISDRVVGDQGGVAMVRDQRRQHVDQAEAFIGTGQQQDAAVGTNLAGIEGGSDFLLANTWQGKREKGIVSIGEHGTFCPGVESGVSTHLYIIPDGCTMPTSKSLPCS